MTPISAQLATVYASLSELLDDVELPLHLRLHLSDAHTALIAAGVPPVPAPPPSNSSASGSEELAAALVDLRARLLTAVHGSTDPDQMLEVGLAGRAVAAAAGDLTGRPCAHLRALAALHEETAAAGAGTP